MVEGKYNEAVAVEFVALSGTEQTVVEEVAVIDLFDSHVGQIAWELQLRVQLMDQNLAN